MKHTVKPIQSK